MKHRFHFGRRCPIRLHQLLVIAGWLATVSCSTPGRQGALPPTQHVIDTHIHLYDTRRQPEKITWPPKDDTVLYKPHMPGEYNRVAKAAGVTGVVIVEASLELEDNQWVLDLVADDPFYVGLVGNIDVRSVNFEEQLLALKKDERLVGIRARSAGAIDYADPQVLSNLRLLARHNLTLDFLANGQGVPGVQTVDRLARALPELRIVVDHVLGYDIDGKPPGDDWKQAVARLAGNRNVYCKVSGLYQRSTRQPAPQDVEYYRSVLDVLWDAFGVNRLIYGSNWPVTKRSRDYASFVKLVDAYFADKGQAARERYYWMNAESVYRLKL